MENAAPQSITAPYEDRRGWLIAFGVIDILFGCGFLLMLGLVAFAFLGPFATTMAGSAAPRGPMPKSFLVAAVFLQYGLATALFFTGGIGSIRCKNWARILMLVISGLWLALGLMVTATMALTLPVIMRGQVHHTDPDIFHGVITGLLIFIAILTIIIPSIFLFFYSRPSVKATCIARNMPPAPMESSGAPELPVGTPAASLPVPLAILGGWEATTALSVVAVLFMRMTIMFGVVLHGASAVMVLLAYSLLSAFAAWFIFKKNLAGWYLALGKTAIWTASLIVTCFRPVDMAKIMRDQGYDEKTLTISNQMPHLMTGTMAMSAILMTGLVCYILYARKYFPTDPQTS